MAQLAGVVSGVITVGPTAVGAVAGLGADDAPAGSAKDIALKIATAQIVAALL